MNEMDKVLVIFFSLFGGLLVVLIFTLVCYFAGYQTGYDQAKAEAFKRGHAVQCLGKEDHYWECESGRGE
jgi:hypothetical protein